MVEEFYLLGYNPVLGLFLILGDGGNVFLQNTGWL
jgi:hypothetical protein